MDGTIVDIQPKKPWYEMNEDDIKVEVDVALAKIRPSANEPDTELPLLDYIKMAVDGLEPGELDFLKDEWEG